MQILAVDDEPNILELLPLLTARVGFPHIVTASSGAGALEILSRPGTNFDCLLFDINMPDIDGIELCRLVRQIDTYRRTPIIILTAMSEREYIDSAFQAGATDYVTKPFDITELGVRLRLASELVAARKASAISTSQREETTDEPLLRRTDLHEAIEIEGAQSVADIVSFKNYLKQLSRSGLAASQLIAIGVRRISEHHGRASGQEFQYILREVVDAIGAVMLNTLSLISYHGNGMFVALSNSAAVLTSEDLESEIQSIIDERDVQLDDGTSIDLEISVGNPVQPHFGGIADVETSIERAIARARAKMTARPHKTHLRQFR